MEPVLGSVAWRAQDKGPFCLAICWTVITISSFFVVARVCSRCITLGKLRNDDYFAILGHICGCVSTVFSTVAVLYGNGKHSSLLTPHQQQKATLWTMISICPAIISLGLPKLAVVALLARILNPSRFHKWILWITGICCQLALLATVGMLLGLCIPARSLWNLSEGGKCFNMNFFIAYSICAGCMYIPSDSKYYREGLVLTDIAYSAFVDIYLAVYPAIVLYKIQMPRKKKLFLSLALGVGSMLKGAPSLLLARFLSFTHYYGWFKVVIFSGCTRAESKVGSIITLPGVR
ncbi:unnamed protein product [Clonostachys solani]|uniref:Rhodopsin domain-containing protein n=1 Tax=Clonostachys solani TaxID=160281 RepID=A0A9N9Z9F7_9HYPO|nr:unnamed protein product [Clonostachys solani]